MNHKCPIRTCASCEYTYWGGRNLLKSCPKCGFAYYGAHFVYGSWRCAIWQLLTKQAYRRQQK